jgi:hypothetical protein
VQSAS